MKRKIFAVMLVALFTVACQDQAPTDPLTDPVTPLALNASDEHRAYVYTYDKYCGLFDGDGNLAGPFPTRNVITQSHNGNAHAICHVDVPNSTGKAVQYSATDNPLSELWGIPIPCGVWDGSSFIISYNWSETVSASGKARMLCHAP